MPSLQSPLLLSDAMDTLSTPSDQMSPAVSMLPSGVEEGDFGRLLSREVQRPCGCSGGGALVQVEGIGRAGKSLSWLRGSPAAKGFRLLRLPINTSGVACPGPLPPPLCSCSPP